MKSLKHILPALGLWVMLIQSSFAQLQLDSTILTIETIAEDLFVPWEIVWGPDDMIWITERPGTVKRLNP